MDCKRSFRFRIARVENKSLVSLILFRFTEFDSNTMRWTSCQKLGCLIMVDSLDDRATFLKAKWRLSERILPPLFDFQATKMRSSLLVTNRVVANRTIRFSTVSRPGSKTVNFNRSRPVQWLINMHCILIIMQAELDSFLASKCDNKETLTNIQRILKNELAAFKTNGQKWRFLEYAFEMMQSVKVSPVNVKRRFYSVITSYNSVVWLNFAIKLNKSGDFTKSGQISLGNCDFLKSVFAY